MNSTDSGSANSGDEQQFSQNVFEAAQALIGEGDREVDSGQIAVRLSCDEIDVRQAVKHLSEQDRLTASFPTDEPALITEVGS